MTYYDDYENKLTHTPLQGPNGEAWSTAFGIVKDAVVQGAINGIKCRFITVCPPDALQYHGLDRFLEQYPIESTNAYRLRLQNAWGVWAIAGTRLGVLTAVQGLGYTNVTIKENIEWSGNPSPGYVVGDEWWRFWVIIDQPHGFQPGWLWGDGSTWGPSKLFGLAGSGGSAAAVASIGAAIKKWKPAHAILVNVIVVLSGNLWGYPAWTWGGGNTWGAVAAYLSF